MKIVLIPGMGCKPAAHSNWYRWMATEMNQRANVQCILQDFPDPYQCRESIWVPHVQKLVGGDASSTILVGHSSGAACAMRLLEYYHSTKTPLAGCVLVATAYTDLNDEDERRSEYFNRPWQWESMAQGASKIVLFHGTDDHLIPVREARYIADQLRSVSSSSLQSHTTFEYWEMQDKSHFFEPWPELLESLDAMISTEKE